MTLVTQSHFSHCYEYPVPKKNHLTGGRVSLGLQFRGMQSIMVRMRHKDQEVAAYPASAVNMERAMHEDAHPSSLFTFSLRPSLVEWAPTHLG